MRYVDNNYFRNINRFVNSNEYNAHSIIAYQPVLTMTELNVSSYESIKNQIDLEGFALVNLPNYNVLSTKEITEWLEGLLGKTYSETNPQKLPYAKVQSEKNPRYYINSSVAQPVHTDEGYTTCYPRYAALYCRHNVQIGGDSIIVQVKYLYDSLVKLFSDNAKLLFELDALTIEGASGIKVKPLLIGLENGEIGISYTSTLKSLKCDERIFQGFDFITNYIHDIKNQIRFKLQNGQILIFDNCRVLHGRTRFTPDSNRLLYRFWFLPRSL